jgi:hypothetical protein
LDRSTPVNREILYVSAQTHQKFPFQTHISFPNRLQQYKVFAELFSKSDRIPILHPRTKKEKTTQFCGKITLCHLINRGFFDILI